MDDNECVETPTESADRAIAKLAASQFGVFSREQALGLGFTARQIQFRLAGGRWESVLPGVYRIVGATDSPQQAALAASLWAGHEALVSHGTAAALWGIEGVRCPDVELWVPAESSARSEQVRVHRGQRLDRADRSSFEGIPVTTPIRTLIDVSGRLEDDRLLAAMESVFRQQLGTPERLQRRLASLRRSGRPGAGRLDALLAQRGDGRALESRLEAKVWMLVRGAGVALPSRQHWVTVEGGRYRLDFAWPSLRVGLECDSFEHHGTRGAFGKDRARYAELVAARWRVLPVTWHACTKERDRVVRWIRSLVAAAA